MTIDISTALALTSLACILVGQITFRTGKQAGREEIQLPSDELLDEAYQSGYADGEAEGFGNGRIDGYLDGEEDGRAQGYEEGFEAGLDQVAVNVVLENDSHPSTLLPGEGELPEAA